MRLNDVNLYIDSSPMLTLMRTKRYLNFAAKCWKNVFGACADEDQLLMYRADEKRCRLSEGEKKFAQTCWKMTSTVFASVVNAEMEKETPLDYDAVGENADAILDVIADAIRARQKNTNLLPHRNRCVRFSYRGRAVYTYERDKPDLRRFEREKSRAKQTIEGQI